MMDIPQFLAGIAIGSAIGSSYWVWRGYRSGAIRWWWRGYSDRDLEVAKQIREVQAGMRPGSYTPLTRGEFYALKSLLQHSDDRTNAGTNSTGA